MMMVVASEKQQLRIFIFFSPVQESLESVLDWLWSWHDALVQNLMHTERERRETRKNKGLVNRSLGHLLLGSEAGWCWQWKLRKSKAWRLPVRPHQRPILVLVAWLLSRVVVVTFCDAIAFLSEPCWWYFLCREMLFVCHVEGSIVSVLMGIWMWLFYRIAYTDKYYKTGKQYWRILNVCIYRDNRNCGAWNARERKERCLIPSIVKNVFYDYLKHMCFICKLKLKK